MKRVEWSLDYLNDSADVRSMFSSMRERSDGNESSLHDGAGATSISRAHRSMGGGSHENAGRSPCMIGSCLCWCEIAVIVEPTTVLA